MIFYENVIIKEKNKLSEGIFEIRFDSANIAGNAGPGQFINIYPNDNSRLLPRPISICEITGNELRLVFRAVGKGTEEFSKFEKGSRVNVSGPVGNGYDIDFINENYSSVILFGGGIGIPPMIELSNHLTVETNVFLGYRDVLFLNEDFNKNSTVYIATEDGSCGTRGNVLDALNASGIKGDVICACGPLPMLRAIKKYAADNDIPAYISLEERMACGVGACLGCVCNTVKKDDHSQVNNARICVDGPVFKAADVEI